MVKSQKKFGKAFGLNEKGLIDFPKKISSVRISRIKNVDKMGGCSYCFPHGIDTTNSKHSKFTRNWKKYRLKQYKSLNFGNQN
ncbi:hypothetical protein MTsPCn5_16970 [Croceitalea sp. MTPC5]|uniref:Phosphate ABC transporter substrate-binding protein n=1 Tax=Croceitalea marina TaxID=1775166 RepID=A0ABW5MY61_9FLAO|nr:hypothetical protein MTsPCn5_16970 [Croceitalea sp. MTPC5]